MMVDIVGLIPHTFLRVTHPDGRIVEYGLVPKKEQSPFGPGKINVTGVDGPAKEVVMAANWH